MAYALVQTISATSGLAVTFGAGPTENNLLVAAAQYVAGSGGITGIPSGWTEISSPVSSTFRIAYKVAGAAESATVTFPGSGVGGSIVAAEYSGGATSSIFDVSANDTNISTVASSGTTATTAEADELAVAILSVWDEAADVGAPNNSFAQRLEIANANDANFSLSLNDRMPIAIGTYSTQVVLLSNTLNNNLQVSWSLDEVSGSRVDAVGALDLADFGTVGSTAGVISNAASFSAASSEYLSVADDAALRGGNVDYTLSAWVRLADKTDERGIIGKDDSTTGNRDYWLSYFDASDRFRLACFTATDNPVVVLANDFGSPSINTWYLVVAWHDATANTLNIQINDGPVTSASIGALQSPGTADLRVGARSYSGSPLYMDGDIDIVCKWSRVLTAAERTELYNSGAGRQYPFSGGAVQYNGIIATFKKLPVTSYEGVVSDQMTFAQVTSSIGAFTLLLSETINLNDIAQDYPIIGLITEALAMNDTLVGAYSKVLTETLNMDDTLATLFYANTVLAETVNLNDTLATNGIWAATLTELVNFDDTLTPTAIFQATLTENLVVGIGIIIDGETYTGWVMNTRNFGVTQYTNYEFNSFANLDGTYLGANSSGIFELTGADDAGTNIAAAIKSGITNFNSSNLKRVPEAYLGIRNNGPMVLKITEDETKERWYELTQSGAGMHTEKVKLGRGVKATNWQFELVNKDGKDFDLDSIEFLPIILSRRI